MPRIPTSSSASPARRRSRRVLACQEAAVDGDIDSPGNLARGGVIGRLGLDLYHSLHHFLPLGLRVPRVVLTLHDLIWVEHRSLIRSGGLAPISRLATNLYARAAMGFALRRADRIIAISAHTAARATAHFGLDPSRIEVIPHGVNPALFPLAAEAPRSDPPYFLCLGNTRPYKNIPTALRAFALCADSTGPAANLGVFDWSSPDAATARPICDSSPRASASTIASPSRVPCRRRRSSGCSTALRRCCFRRSWKGSAFPVLEAMSAGCPVIASRAPAIAEIAGDAALSCNADDAEAFAAAMQRLLTEPGLRARAARGGRVARERLHLGRDCHAHACGVRSAARERLIAMARIYLDTWCMKSDASGMGRYGRGLIPALIASAPQHEFLIVRPAAHRGRAPLVPSGSASAREVFVARPAADWTTLLVRPLLEPAFRRFGRPDLYHSLFHLLPVGLRLGQFAPRSIIVSLHDLIWLDRDVRAERHQLEAAWLKRFGGIAIPHALRAADHVICGSDATATRAARWLPPGRRTTVYYGIDEHWFELAPAGDPVSPPYIAAFGVAKAYKNIPCVIRALSLVRERRPDVALVLIGGDGGADLRSSGQADHISVTPAVADADLRALIRGARVFVVPSLVEGFGLPALEAMAAGTPLVVSDIEALREVVAGAALRFDPADPTQLAESILRVLDDDRLARDLVERGRARAAPFTWARAAAATLAVYERVLKPGSGAVSPDLR